MQSRSIAFVLPFVALAWPIGCGGSGTSSSAATGSGGGTSSDSSTATATSTSTGQGGGTTSSSTATGTSSSTSSATSSSTASGSSSSTGGGMVCTWSAGNNPCGAGMYCDAPGCGQGTCAPVGAAEMPDKNAVCGCDTLTYWNASVAASHGVATSGAGACMPGKTCGGFGGFMCPAGASCNYGGADKSVCQIADGGGTCWVLPAQCGMVVGFGPQTRACGAMVCTDECDLIKQQVAWYPDNTCPQ
jgi:hypothetical protein